jgi:hypothetical protein
MEEGTGVPSPSIVRALISIPHNRGDVSGTGTDEDNTGDSANHHPRNTGDRGRASSSTGLLHNTCLPRHPPSSFQREQDRCNIRSYN